MPEPAPDPKPISEIEAATLRRLAAEIKAFFDERLREDLYGRYLELTAREMDADTDASTRP